MPPEKRRTRTADPEPLFVPAGARLGSPGLAGLGNASSPGALSDLTQGKERKTLYCPKSRPRGSLLPSRRPARPERDPGEAAAGPQRGRPGPTREPARPPLRSRANPTRVGPRAEQLRGVRSSAGWGTTSRPHRGAACQDRAGSPRPRSAIPAAAPTKTRRRLRRGAALLAPRGRGRAGSRSAARTVTLGARPRGPAAPQPRPPPCRDRGCDLRPGASRTPGRSRCCVVAGAVPREPAGGCQHPPRMVPGKRPRSLRAAAEGTRAVPWHRAPGKGSGVRSPRRCGHGRQPLTLACPGPCFGMMLCFLHVEG